MTDPTLQTYSAFRAAWVRDREQQYRRDTRGIPTKAQRGKWAAEFDRWARDLQAVAWDAGHQSGSTHLYYNPIPTNPYRED